MLNPFIHLIGQVIWLINLALLVWVVLGLLMHFDIVNRHNPLIQRIYYTLGKVLEPLLRPIRNLLNKIPALRDTGVDISPIILILLLNFISDAMYSWFYRI